MADVPFLVTPATPILNQQFPLTPANFPHFQKDSRSHRSPRTPGEGGFSLNVHGRRYGLHSIPTTVNVVILFWIAGRGVYSEGQLAGEITILRNVIFYSHLIRALWPAGLCVIEQFWLSCLSGKTAGQATDSSRNGSAIGKLSESL